MCVAPPIVVEPVVNGSVAMAALSNSIECAIPGFSYAIYSLSNLVECVRSSSIASTNTESMDTEFSLPYSCPQDGFHMYQRIWTPLDWGLI